MVDFAVNIGVNANCSAFVLIESCYIPVAL